MPATAIAGAAAGGLSRRRRPNILYRHDRRPCLGRDELLRQPRPPDAQHGPPGRRRHALLQRLLSPIRCARPAAPPRSPAATRTSTACAATPKSKDANERMRPGIATWPKLLQQAGYRTGVVGKWHLNDEPAGFDYSCVLPGQGVYFDPEFIENGQRKKIPGYATDITTDLALQFPGPGAATSPFALIYQHKAPHRPFTPAPRHAGMFSAGPALSRHLRRRLRHAPHGQEAADMRFDISLAGDYPDLPQKPAARRAQALDLPALRQGPLPRRLRAWTRTSGACSTTWTRTSWPKTP